MKKFKRFYSAVIVLLCFSQASFAAAISSTAAGGAWSAGASWVGGIAPVAGDDVTIVDGATITVTSTVACATLNVGQGATGVLTFGTANMGITVTGLTTIANGARINFTTTSTVNRTFADVTVSAGGIWSNTGNSTIFITGSLTHNGATFTSGTGVYTLSGAGKTINGTALTISNLTITGTYTNNVTTLTAATTLSGAGTLTMGASSSLVITGTSLITGLDCATNTPNTVTYNGGAQTVKSGIAYYNLTIQTAGIKTINAINTTINNNLTINAGSLYDGGNQIVGNATGTFSIAAGATFQMGAAVAAATTSNWPTNFTTGTSSVSATSTVIYNTTAAVTVSAVPASYGNLTLSGASTKTAGGAHVINGILTQI